MLWLVQILDPRRCSQRKIISVCNLALIKCLKYVKVATLFPWHNLDYCHSNNPFYFGADSGCGLKGGEPFASLICFNITNCPMDTIIFFVSLKLLLV